MPDSANKNGIASLIEARKVLSDEVYYRRDKLWKIFSWTSSILIAIIAGEAALISNHLNIPFDTIGISALVVIVTLMIYSLGWINQNLKIQSETEKAITEIDHKLAIPVIEIKKPIFGYRLTVFFLSITAIYFLILIA